jgi:SAM-dependent methyltransferase
MLRFIIPYVQGKKVLDVGCGVGDYLSHFSHESVGIDASLPSLEECRKKGLVSKYGDLNKRLELKMPASMLFYAHTYLNTLTPL